MREQAQARTPPAAVAVVAILAAAVLLVGCGRNRTFSRANALDVADIPDAHEPMGEYTIGPRDILELRFFRRSSPVQSEYRLNVNDVVNVTFPFYPELNVEFVVPPDGMVQFQKIGAVRVAGRTTAELRDLLIKRYSRTETNPNPVVTLVSFYSAVDEFLSIVSAEQKRYVVTVRNDGMITLPLIDEVMLEGLTPDEANRTIRARMEKVIPELEVSVAVQLMESRKVMVIGEVETPGVYPLLDFYTPINAIGAAGGFKRGTAYTDEVLVIRRDGQDRSLPIRVDNPASLGADGEQLFLRPYDIVYVSPRKISRVADALQEVYRLVPQAVQTGVGVWLGFSLSGRAD